MMNFAPIYPLEFFLVLCSLCLCRKHCIEDVMVKIISDIEMSINHMCLPQKCSASSGSATSISWSDGLSDRMDPASVES